MKNQQWLKKRTDKVASQDPLSSYAYSPLNKSEETKFFENIVRDTMDDIKNKNNPPKVNFEKNKDGKLLVHYLGASVNMKDLMQNVNLQHLTLPPEITADYAELVGSKHSNAISKKEMDKKIAGADIIQQTSLSKLEYGEQLAIRIYTGDDYASINNLLRGVPPPTNRQKDIDRLPESVKESILHAAIASQGLTKVPDIDLPYVVRCQDEYGLKQMKKNAKTHAVTEEKGFISTAFNPQARFGDVEIVYQNVRGKSISAISTLASENEYLIPPSTQVKWTGYRFKDGMHQFTAEGSNVLMDINNKQQLLPCYHANIEIKKLLHDYEKEGKMSPADLKEFLTEVVNINIKHGQITPEQADVYLKPEANNKSKQDMDIDSITSTPSTSRKLYNALGKFAKTFGLVAMTEFLENKKDKLNLAALKSRADTIVKDIRKSRLVNDPDHPSPPISKAAKKTISRSIN